MPPKTARDNPALVWDPALLAQAETLEWRSRVLMEGYLQGQHRSPLRGFSTEFAQYTPYTQGDDIRHLDWHVMGRLNRLCIRQYQAETNLRCQVVLDASRSMAYRSDRAALSKYAYASLLTAALFRLLMRQNDACGLTLASAASTTDQSGAALDHLPPALGDLPFQRLLAAIERHAPAEARPPAASEPPKDLAFTLNRLAPLWRRRGLLVVFTDAFEEPAPLLEALKLLRIGQHELCLVQVIDPREQDFDFEVSRTFEDLETAERLPVSPTMLRKRYRLAFDEHQNQLREGCRGTGVRLLTVRTDEAPFAALSTLVQSREGRA
ncbi:MAG: DUF58 domain-containing protein [Planctomycetota bacterium]